MFWLSGKRYRSSVGLALALLVTLAACSTPRATSTTESGSALTPTTAEEAAATAATAGPTATPSGLEAEPLADEVADFAARRARMVEQGVVGWGIDDESVIEVMGRVPRHRFVPVQYLEMAYENHPLPIGYGQTISQPYIVALMTQEAAVGPGDKVLEIGTGSGYQAAVLAELADQVYSMEIIGPLAEQAAAAHSALGYQNITVRHADGYFGWPEEAPFDAIVVTAAPDHIPQPLVEQLKPGGRMVIPVGPVGGFQTLWLVTKTEDGEVTTRDLGGVTFVPLTRETR